MRYFTPLKAENGVLTVKDGASLVFINIDDASVVAATITNDFREFAIDSACHNAEQGDYEFEFNDASFLYKEHVHTRVRLSGQTEFRYNIKKGTLDVYSSDYYIIKELPQCDRLQ